MDQQGTENAIALAPETAADEKDLTSTAVIVGNNPATCDGMYPTTRDGRCQGCGAPAHVLSQRSPWDTRVIEGELVYMAPCLRAPSGAWVVRVGREQLIDVSKELGAFEGRYVRITIERPGP